MCSLAAEALPLLAARLSHDAATLMVTQLRVRYMQCVFLFGGFSMQAQLLSANGDFPLIH
jgi:hypothetical protein